MQKIKEEEKEPKNNEGVELWLEETATSTRSNSFLDDEDEDDDSAGAANENENEQDLNYCMQAI